MCLISDWPEVYLHHSWVTICSTCFRGCQGSWCKVSSGSGKQIWLGYDGESMTKSESWDHKIGFQCRATHHSSPGRCPGLPQAVTVGGWEEWGAGRGGAGVCWTQQPGAVPSLQASTTHSTDASWQMGCCNCWNEAEMRIAKQTWSADIITDEQTWSQTHIMGSSAVLLKWAFRVCANAKNWKRQGIFIYMTPFRHKAIQSVLHSIIWARESM